MKRIAIVQSSYIPWRGYFELMEKVDEFILLDDVQFTRRDWRNRNKIRTKRGDQWLTIPLKQSGNYQARIDEMRVSDPLWMHQHFQALRAAYGGSRNWKRYEDALYFAYLDAPDDLSGINRRFIDLACEWLGIGTKITRSSDYDHQGSKSDNLVSLCKSSSATRYLTGQKARGYLDEPLFNQNGIAVDWMEYSDWPRLTFLHGLLTNGAGI
jgi:WbqC-like protein